MNAFHIAWWDLVRVTKDKSAPLWLFVMPIIFIFFIGNMMGQGDRTLWVPVIDLDNSDLSEQFVNELRTEGFYVDVRAATEEPWVREWVCSIVIPATFSENILAGEEARIDFVEKRGQQDRGMAIQAQLIQATVRFTGGLIQTGAINSPWSEERNEALKEILEKPQQVTVARMTDKALRPPPTGYNLSFPGILIQFVLQMTVMIGGIALVIDRQTGAFTRLVASPVDRLTIFVGKILSRMAQGSVQAIVLLAVGWLMFSIPTGQHPLALVSVILCFSLCFSCMGIFLGLVCSNEPQAVTLGIVISILLAAIGGCWWPIEFVPQIMKQIAMLTPSYWGLRGLQDVIMFEKSVLDILPICGILLGYTAVFIAISVPFANRYKV